MGAQKDQPEIHQPGTIAEGSLDGCMTTLLKHWLKVNASWKSFLSSSRGKTFYDSPRNSSSPAG
jgi:hypothetical protein